MRSQKLLTQILKKDTLTCQNPVLFNTIGTIDSEKEGTHNIIFAIFKSVLFDSKIGKKNC